MSRLALALRAIASWLCRLALRLEPPPALPEPEPVDELGPEMRRANEMIAEMRALTEFHDRCDRGEVPNVASLVRFRQRRSRRQAS